MGPHSARMCWPYVQEHACECLTFVAVTLSTAVQQPVLSTHRGGLNQIELSLSMGSKETVLAIPLSICMGCRATMLKIFIPHACHFGLFCGLTWVDLHDLSPHCLTSRAGLPRMFGSPSHVHQAVAYRSTFSVLHYLSKRMLRLCCQ